MRFRANLVGGELEIRREPGGGTQVSCLVPDSQRAQGQPRAAAALRPPAAVKRATRASQSKRKKRP